jgi:hypothetical protein
MAKEERALVNQNGSLVEIQIVEASKIAKDQDWPKYVPVIREGEPPTRFHAKVDETAKMFNGNWQITSIYALSMPLDEIKVALKRDVDARAESLRVEYVTPGSSQAMIYEAKRAEVRRWKDAGMPAEANAEEYPWASARSTRKGVLVVSVLSEWGNLSDIWTTIAIQIEGVREAAKEQIGAADTVDQACETFDAIDWSIE